MTTTHAVVTFADRSFVFESGALPGFWRAAGPDGEVLTEPDPQRGGRPIKRLFRGEAEAVAALREKGYAKGATHNGGGP